MGIFDGVAAGFAELIGGIDRNRQQSSAAQNQIDWQNVWRSNAHQTEADDLEKAGLNRMLTMGGPGAPMGSAQQPTIENSMKGVTASAKEAALLSAQMDKLKAETENTIVDTQTKGATAELNNVLIPFIQKAGGFLGSSAKGKDSIVEDALDKIMPMSTGEGYQRATDQNYTDLNKERSKQIDLKKNRIKLRGY